MVIVWPSTVIEKLSPAPTLVGTVALLSVYLRSAKLLMLRVTASLNFSLPLTVYSTLNV